MSLRTCVVEGKVVEGGWDGAAEDQSLSPHVPLVGI